MAAPPSNLKQCQPILQHDPSNIWARLEQVLQTVYEGFREACRAAGIEAYIGRNNLFEYPYSVFFEGWLPNDPTDPALTDRVWAKVTLTLGPITASKSNIPSKPSIVEWRGNWVCSAR